MGVYVDVIAEQALGTGTAKTQLSGNRTANAAGSYNVPAAGRGLLAYEPYVAVTTVTAADDVIVTEKIEADDLGIKDFEVFAPPISGLFGANSSANCDPMRFATYPLMFPTAGGETVNFYAIPQQAITGNGVAGGSLWWTDTPGAITDLPFRAKVGGAAAGAASLTSTGTTANGSVTGATLTVSGQVPRTIRSLIGLLTNQTPAAAKPVTGYFVVTAAEMAYAQYFAAEPSQPFLGTSTGNSQGHITRADNLFVPLQPPSTISLNLWLSSAPSTTGKFAVGILYN